MIKNVLKIIIVFILGVGGGVFYNQIICPYIGPIYKIEKTEITIQENTALKNSIEKVEKAVVGIKTITKDKKILEGSGLIITYDGYIVTLADLIPEGSDFSLFINGNIVSSQIIKIDSKEKLALIKTEKTDLSTVGFGDFNSIRAGERVFLVGVIFNDKEIQQSVNEGIIKSFSKDLINTSVLEENNLNGSPLFDIEGKVLGLNTVDKDGKVNTIPISKIRQFTNF